MEIFRSLLEVVGGLSNVLLHILGDLVLGVDRLDRALRLTGTAIDALFGVDQELIPTVVDAVHRTHLNAALVLRADAGLGYDVGHCGSSSRSLVVSGDFIPTYHKIDYRPLIAVIVAYDRGHES